jgi:hypothetical protein
MLAWALSVGLGASVGLTELTTRYRDEPSALPKLASFWTYVALNAAASAAAYALILSFGWTFGVAAGAGRSATQVLGAGFSAMALIRSSLVILKVGDQEVDVGPSAVLASLLSVVDRAVDRSRAAERSRSVGEAMRAVSFAKAKLSLPPYCLGLMQNVPLEEQQKLRTAVDALGLLDIDDELKSLNLGLLLMNVVGPVVLQCAVRDLGDLITDGEAMPRRPARRAGSRSTELSGTQ